MSVLLFSGGVDSSTLLWELMAQGEEVRPLFVDYGQAHAGAELLAATQLAARAPTPSLVVKVVPGGSLGLALPGRVGSEAVCAGRNMLLIALACHYANRVGDTEVVLGTNLDDHRDFPDCRPPWLEAMAKACEAYGVRLRAPFQGLRRSSIMRRAHRLGVPLKLCWSCYEGGDDPCGECSACLLRERA